VESPLGNTVPVQALADLAESHGLVPSIVTWNAPRNDRYKRGRTIRDAARDLAEATAGFDAVVYLDDAITGTRFLKLFPEILLAAGKSRLAAIAMTFIDPNRPNATLRPSLMEQVNEHAHNVGIGEGVIPFPPLRPFRIDAGSSARWESPMIWGESDLIAGKRKINLVFTLLDHLFGFLAEMATQESKFLPYLQQAWSQDTTGLVVEFAPDVLKGAFQAFTSELNSEDLRGVLHEEARTCFPMDYEGKLTSISEEELSIRIGWIRDAFIRQAVARVGEQKAWTLWRAFDDAWAASASEIRPRPTRDHDYAPYTLPYNRSISALNRRLRENLRNLSIAANV
jgi:hypothetical protein